MRNYLDVLLGLPWGKKSKVKKDIAAAQAVLDEDHYALEKVKERIVEYLAVQARTNKLKGPILCLVGPPGVGKTSLGKSIAKATGREFIRQSLGGGARRGRDQRPSPDVHRLAAGQDRHQPQAGRDGQPVVPARRDRQTRPGFPRRSGVRTARSARPGAEQQVSGSLSGDRHRSVGCDVRLHREQPEPAAAAARSHGDHPARRLYRAGEAGDRQGASARQTGGGARAQGGRVHAYRRRAARPNPLLHARSWCSHAGARDRAAWRGRRCVASSKRRRRP